jgi:hypothetical protein
LKARASRAAAMGETGWRRMAEDTVARRESSSGACEVVGLEAGGDADADLLHFGVVAVEGGAEFAAAVFYARVEMGDDGVVEAELDLVGEATGAGGVAAVVGAGSSNEELDVGTEGREVAAESEARADQAAADLVAVGRAPAAGFDDVAGVSAEAQRAGFEQGAVHPEGSTKGGEAVLRDDERAAGGRDGAEKASAAHRVDRVLRMCAGADES